MLTFVKDSSAVELVGIHRNSNRSRKPEATVYFTHDGSPEKANIAPAAGVLELHRDSLKKLNKLSQASFDTICTMLDEGTEPEVGDPLRSEYWEIKKVFERSLRREMYLGDSPDVRFELNLPRDKGTWGAPSPVSAIRGPGKPTGSSSSSCATCERPSPTRGGP